MKQQYLQEIIHLTQECLERFWQKDPEYVIHYFDRDILWIGSVRSQYMEGEEKAAEVKRKRRKQKSGEKQAAGFIRLFFYVMEGGSRCRREPG